MRIGVDLGGSKIAAIALDAQGRVRAERRIASPSHDYARVLQAIGGLVDAIENELGVAELSSVGLGIPGSLSPATGLVRNANSTVLNGRPLQQDLDRLLGRAVRIENDANCFALSEATDGAGQGARVVFGVILGTGVGGGMVVEGRVLAGANGIGGEWGHLELPSRGEPDLPRTTCWCGRENCIETYLSGPGLARDHARDSGASAPAVTAITAITAITAADLGIRAAAGDADAAATLARHVQRLARGLAIVVDVLDPDVIVLGGGVSNLPDLAAQVEAALVPHVFADAFRTPVRRHVHGDASGVRGAAWLHPA